MSERGVFAVDREFWEMWPDLKPLTEREAYMWVGCFGPVVAKYSWLADQWRWPTHKARKFVYKLFGAGLFIKKGRNIEAVPISESVPAASGVSWTELRAFVFARDGYACVYCGSPDTLHCDHVVPRVQGGADHADNLVTSCAYCNLSKGAKSLSEWRQ